MCIYIYIKSLFSGTIELIKLKMSHLPTLFSFGESFMGKEGTFSRKCIFTSSLMAFPSLLSWFLHHFQMTEWRAYTIFSFLAVDNYSYLCTGEHSCSRLQGGWAIPSSLPRRRGRKGRDSRVHCTAQWALRMYTSSYFCRVHLLRTLS